MLLFIMNNINVTTRHKCMPNIHLYQRLLSLHCTICLYIYAVSAVLTTPKHIPTSLCMTCWQNKMQHNGLAIHPPQGILVSEDIFLLSGLEINSFAPVETQPLFSLPSLNGPQSRYGWVFCWKARLTAVWKENLPDYKL